ncbi:hypothetical protein AB3329_01045 [Streptococcus sp. H31]|uniref:hypothetical protein n=1 Tax=Streptococcus huangxiaojuni TaxID=3237239 RepID=UPI0034A5D1E0
MLINKKNELDEETLKNIIAVDLDNREVENNIFYFLLKISNGEMKRFSVKNDFTNTNSLVFAEETERILSEIYQELPINFEYIELSRSSNSQLSRIVDMFEEALDRKIQQYYYSFTREKVLLSLLRFSSIISRLTFSAYEKVDETKEINTIWDRMIVLWQTFHRDPVMDNRGFIGELKGSLEAAVNDLLLAEITFSRDTSLEPDLEKILVLYHSKIYLWQIRHSIPILFERRGELLLNSQIGIGIPAYILEAFSNYQRRLKNVTQRVMNEKSDNVFSRFEIEYGFRPEVVLEYLSLADDQRAHKLEGIAVSLSPKELLIEDIRFNRKLSRRGAEDAINVFVLNDNNYYRLNSDGHFWSSNNRLFRTPLIELESFYLLPTFTFMEAALYLPKRILTRENGTKGSYNKFVKLNEFDEYDLPTLQEHLNSWNISSLINFDLAQINQIKEKIEEKKITKEYDLLYVYKENLFIWNLKNWGFEYNLFEVKKIFKI